MKFVNEIIDAITFRIGHDVGTFPEILAMLLMTTLMSLYVFLVYKFVYHKSLYNKSFHLSVVVIPFFIASIVMALQSNIVITLGTIGALAIIRYRTAVKDPVDMIYILWSVFIGITCGCRLYELCILTSIFVTVVLVLFNSTNAIRIFGNKFYILVINSKTDDESIITEIIKKYSRNVKLKSKNVSKKRIDYVYQFETKKTKELLENLSSMKEIDKYSLIEYDSEDIT